MDMSLGLLLAVVFVFGGACGFLISALLPANDKAKREIFPPGPVAPFHDGLTTTGQHWR